MDKGEFLDRWKQFFNEHLNGEVAHGDHVEAQLRAPAADEQFSAPDLATVRKIRQLKNNRASGKIGYLASSSNMEERSWLERSTW